MSRPARSPRRRYPLSLHLRTALSRRRRLVAAALLSTALALAVLRLAPPDGPTVPVVVAVRTLPAGSPVTAEDLAVAAYPRALAPEGAAADPAELAGRTLAGAVVPGQPLTATAVVGPGLLAGRPPGETAVTLRIDDPGALRHVRAGDHVDVVHSPDAVGAHRDVLGRGLPVLWVAADPPPGDGGLLAGDAGAAADRGLLVVGAAHQDAVRLAGAAGGGRTTVVLVPAPGPSGPDGPDGTDALSPSAGAAGP
ncbi:Flp pilus assembly protein CpaB [Kocuria flava]|uniref:Flp pilus assembly protein CpaB n=1 Tax=Kocuria flava TaxID=446860 RepID=UPI003F1E468F